MPPTPFSGGALVLMPRTKSSCASCSKLRVKCGVGHAGCLNVRTQAAVESPIPTQANKKVRNQTPVDYTSIKVDKFYDGKGKLNWEVETDKRSKAKRKAEKDAATSKATKKASKLTLSSFFASLSARPPTKSAVEFAKVASSAMRVTEKLAQGQPQTKRAGNNSIAKEPVKRLRTALSKGHSIDECRGMYDTSRPVQDARKK